MARIFAIDDVPKALKDSLLKALRPEDEAVLLPSAGLDATSGKYENIVFRFDATTKAVPTTAFSPSWGAGVSCIKVGGAWVDKILSDQSHRHKCLQKLREVVESQTQDPDMNVGPHLDGDENDRDIAEWTAGFDGPACFVGLYSAEHSCAPDPTMRGRDRCHATNFLVVKAGAGQAADQFHSRFMTALKEGSSLAEIFAEGAGTKSLSAGLRRVTRAGSRNRSRILMLASEALGAPMIDSVPDQSSCGRYRAAVTAVDVGVNVLRKVEERKESKQYQYSTGVDAAVSQGLLAMSNLSDGVVLFLSENGDVRQNLRNEAHASLPFSSPRLVSDRDLAAAVVKEYKTASKQRGGHANIDHAFIHDRFAWKNRRFSETDVDIEPLALWGSHDKECFFAKFARELGVSKCQVVRLRPMCVCVAGVESGKLRAALRSMKI